MQVSNHGGTVRSKRVVMPIGAAACIAGLTASAVWPGSPLHRPLQGFTQHQECWQGAGEDIIAVGDSITAGHHVQAVNMRADDSYVDVLSCGSGQSIANLGVWHETSAEIKDRALKELEQTPETMIVLAGTNDLLTGKTANTLPNLETIREKAYRVGTRLIIGLLPPNDRMPAEVEQLNQKIAEWAEEESVQTVDFWAPLAAEDGTFKQGMGVDSTHPSPEGAALMAEQLAEALRR